MGFAWPARLIQIALDTWGQGQQSCKVVGSEWEMFTKRLVGIFAFAELWFTLPVGCLKWGIMRANLVQFCLLPKIDDQSKKCYDEVEQSKKGDDEVKVITMRTLMVKVVTKTISTNDTLILKN